MIYCVEDDEAAGNLEAYALETSGYGVELFSDGKSFFQALAAERPELVLLDIMLPGDDGITILRKLKGDPVSADIPVIMTTAKGTEFDKVRGLDYGADYYLTKPFEPKELLACIRALSRRQPELRDTNALVCGDLKLEKSTFTLYCGDRRF